MRYGASYGLCDLKAQKHNAKNSLMWVKGQKPVCLGKNISTQEIVYIKHRIAAKLAR